ncbi:phosphodiester glycosidase family protein [Sediminimonas sp.]|uniref:phosphodiester glycosidase family protein n=1 Tax=Sediminimonas sp. TaxID=2823379 RepID=UPI0025D253ED|nr:phosphodiester glycosidase family protein [Sediminimonas sp.]
MRPPRIAPTLAAALALWLAAGAAWAVECNDIAHDGRGYTVCRVDAAHEELRLFLYDDSGAPWGSFRRIDDGLRAQGHRLAFAMNAGMYHPDRSPVGLFIEDGQQAMRLVPSAGPGNFGMLPNGVLCLREGRADVIETRQYIAEAPACRHATQSGPMLVIDGALHPRFLPDSTSRRVRNGVGTAADGRTAWFAISKAPVTFHEFARLFRDRLGVDQALFLDGNISRLYAPGLGRADIGLPLGPVVGVIDPVDGR